MRIFVRVPHAWCSAEVGAIDEVAQAAEELGFDGVSVQDHLLSDASVAPCGHAHDGDDRNVFEAMGVLAWLAGRTRRVKLLSGVFVLPYRDPVMTAKQTATLDVLSGGRLIFGAGIGALVGGGSEAGQSLTAHARIAQREFAAMGVRGDRGLPADEFLEALVALWTQESASYHGQHVSFDNLDLFPKPVQRPHPPIWVGGRSPAALRRVGRLADGWFPSQASPEVIAKGRMSIEGHARDAGRPVPVSQGVNLFASVADTDDLARAAVADALGRRFTTGDALAGATLAGAPATVISRLHDYRAVGVDTVDLKLLPLRAGDMLSQMARLAEHVLPALADRQGVETRA